MGIYPEFENLNLEKLIDYWESPPIKGEKKNAALYYSELAFRINSQGNKGRAFLLKQLDKADTTRLRALLDTLPSIEQPLDVNLLLKYLRDKRVMVKAEAIDALAHQGQKDAYAEVAALRYHKSPYVVGAVLRYMSKLYPDKAIPLLIDALTDQRFIVRENAIDELDNLEVVSVVPGIRPLLHDPHPHVRQAAETALENLQEISNIPLSLIQERG